MNKKIIIWLSLIFILAGCNFFKSSKSDLEKILISRPSQKECVFDYAHLLKYTKENKEEALKFFKEKYGIEMIILTMPSLDDYTSVSSGLEEWEFKPGWEEMEIIKFASEIFTNWNIGRDNNGKGILLLLSDKEKLIKVEVGYGAEEVFTDLFCGYIERKQLKSYFENNQVDEGLSATMEEFIGRAEGRLTDEEIKRKMEGYLSGGAGIEREMKIGDISQKEELSEEEKKYFSAQAEPETLLNRWQEKIKRCIQDSNLEMYTEESRIMFRYAPKWSKELCRDLYQRYSRPYEIKVRNNYAVVFYPNSRKEGPEFFKRSESGWQIDILSMGNWVRYNHSNDWFIGGSNHPYMFAFKNNQYSQYVWDYDYYDDFERSSPVTSNYDYYINLYKGKLKTNPNDLETIVSLAEIFFDLRIPKEAGPLLKRAIELNPKDPRAYRYLGLINRDHFCAEETALEYLKKYVDLSPYDPGGYHYVAVTYWRLASYRDTPSYYDKAIEYMKNYAEISKYKIYAYNRLGYFYYLKKDYPEAKKWFKKVLGIDPRDEYAKDMLRGIDEK